MATNSWEMKPVVSTCVYNCSNIYTTQLQNQFFFCITSVMFSESQNNVSGKEGY